jgi:hypothetical protein
MPMPRLHAQTATLSVPLQQRIAVVRAKLLSRRRVLQQKALEELRSPFSIYAKAYERAGCIYVHIPKCGGTSIENMIYGGPQWHLTAAELRFVNQGKFDELYRFSVIRNPWARLYSIYRYTPIDIERFWFSVLRCLRRRSSFEEFVECELTEYFVHNFDFIMPQTSYITVDGNLCMDAIIKFDELSAGMSALSERFPQLSGPLLHENVSGPPVDLDDVYSSRMIRRVGELYKTDIKKFGFRYDRYAA